MKGDKKEFPSWTRMRKTILKYKATNVQISTLLEIPEYLSQSSACVRALCTKLTLQCAVSLLRLPFQEAINRKAVVSAALRSGDWLLAESRAHVARSGGARRVLIPIKSVRCQDLTLHLMTEMGEDSVSNIS